jgi:hypothetical protein
MQHLSNIDEYRSHEEIRGISITLRQWEGKTSAVRPRKQPYNP